MLLHSPSSQIPNIRRLDLAILHYIFIQVLSANTLHPENEVTWTQDCSEVFWRVNSQPSESLNIIKLKFSFNILSIEDNIYIFFWFGFGLANEINDYLSLTIRVVCVVVFNLKCLLIKFVIPNLSQFFLSNYKNQRLSTKLLLLWIHKGYFVVKKLVWNVHIKAFGYTKIFYLINNNQL